MDAITIKAPASVPAGTYQATFEGIEEKTSKRDNNTYWRWLFLMADGTKVSGVSSTNTGPSSKPHRWLRGLLGRPPHPDERLAIDDLVGRSCTLVLDQNEEGYANVAEVLAARPSDVEVASHNDLPDADELPF